MKLATKIRKKVILETYRKDFPTIDFNDYNSSITISDNGRVIMGIDEAIKFGKSSASRDYLPLGIGTFIHNSLIGIDDNNGWIIIEPDGSNLPVTSSVRYKIYNDGSRGIKKYPIENNDNQFTFIELRMLFKQGDATHYKPIKEEPKPIY